MNIKTYCQECAKEITSKVISRKENYTVKDEVVGITASVALCPYCGKDVFCETLDEKNLALAYAAYRKEHRLLSSEEIKAIREKYGLSQRSLGALLGWGEITVHRYETGAIQDRAHNNMIVLIRQPENMREQLVANSDVLPAYVKKNLERRLEILLVNSTTPLLSNALQAALIAGKKTNEFSGFLAFNLEKTKAVIAYIAAMSKGVFKTKLNKLLWYVDFLSFRRYSVPITGNSYTSFKFGPVFDDYDLILGVMEKEGLLIREEVSFPDGTVSDLLKTVQKDVDKSLTEKEKEIISLVVKKFKDFNCKRISDYSHKEIPYKKTSMGKKISYTLADKLSLA